MPPTNKGALLFVNKTSGSSSLSNSRSDSVSSRRINQHDQRSRDLQQERKARRERKKAGLLRGTATLPGRSSTGTQAVGFNEGAQFLPTPPETPDVGEVVAGSSYQQGKPDAYEVEEIVTPTKLDLMIPAGGTVEPFDVVPIPLDKEKYRILQYFVDQMFPAVTRSDAKGLIPGEVSADQLPAFKMMQDALSHPMHTFALLTGASARMQHVTHAELSRSDLTENFADITMKMMREYMVAGQQIDERLLQSMYYLWATESYRRNWDGVRTHEEMVKYLYTTYLGGFRNLNIHLRKMLWFADRFQASATAKPPMIEESWQAEEMTTEAHEAVSKAIRKTGKIQMGSALLKYSAYFSEPFKVLLEEVIELAAVIQCHWTHIGVEVPDRDWVIGRSYTLSDRLLYFKDLRPDAPSALPIIVQDCIRLAMVVWLAFIPSPRTGVSPASSTNIKIRVAVDARPLRYRFASLLGFGRQDIPDSHQEDMDKLFLWLAGVGSLASELEENQQWFTQHFGSLAKKLNIDSWSAFAPIDRSFLWLDRLEAVNDSRITLLLLTRAFETG